MNVQCVVSVVFLFISSSLAQQNTQDAHAIWASPEGTGTLRYACFCEGKWDEPQTISAGFGLALAPSIVHNEDGLFVFWVELLSNGEKKPFFATMDSKGMWSAAVLLDTEIKSTSAITGVIDDDGRLWLSWSGNDWDLTGVAQTSDIYAGVLKDASIINIKKVHDDNDVSDLMPTIAIDSKSRKPVVKWMTLTLPQPSTPIAKLTQGGWVSVNIGTIDADFARPEFSSNIATGIVPLDSLDLPVPSFIRPDKDQISVLMKAF